MEGVKGYIHSIETFGAVDGPGIRYVLFFQGCPLKCLYCHNPDTWFCDEAQQGMETDSAKAVEEILPYRGFFKSGGVTLSGGEPLLQAPFAADILRRLQREGIHTAIDTSGAIPLDASRDALSLACLVLLDIKALDTKLCRRLTGQGNENALATLHYLHAIGKPVWIRHVLLPGYTLEPNALEELADYLTPYENIEKVELLPFHKMGEYKWKEMGYPYSLAPTPEPSEDEVRMARSIFTDRGLPVL